MVSVDAAGADVDTALMPFVVSSAAEIQPGPEADAAVKLAAAAGVVVVVVWLQGWVGLCCAVAGVVFAAVVASLRLFPLSSSLP